MDEEALLAAVIAAPDDDGPRAVLADWLLQRGDPRGELIAVQLELARLPADAPTRPRLVARDLALRHELRDVLPPGTRYERGFPTLLPSTYAIADLPALLARAPYRTLTRSLTAADLDALVALRVPGSVHELWLHARRPGLDETALRRLATWPALAQIAELHLDGDFDPAGLGAVLARCPLRATWIISRGPAEAIAAAIARHAPQVEALRLTGLAVSAEALAMLAPLSPSSLAFSEAGVTPAMLARHRPLLARLTTLELARCPIDDDLAALVGDRLRCLDVWKPTARFGDRGLVALAAAAGLRELKLFGTAITPAGLRAFLAASPPPLERLDLSCNALGDEGAEIVAGWPGARGLRLLKLDETGLTEAGLRALADSPHLRDLDELTVFRNPALREGADRMFGPRRARVHGVG